MLKKLIDAAICRNECDIVLKNADYVDVFCGKVRRGDIGIKANRIIGIGDYKGKREFDLSGLTVLPGFIDAHVHIESSKLTPEGFASLVVPRGTTTVVADPHEIANVCGEAGVEYMWQASRNTPLDVRIMLPSCVPATPFETSGATLSGEDIARLTGEKYVFGLGEFMNYPAVIAGESQALLKLEAAHSAGKPCDGHAPSLTGNALNAYLCAGIITDHECTDAAEIEEKLSKGMYIALRHGSSARNLQSNCKYVTAANARRFIICTDDRHAADLA
ncbi:MAG: amidohydrolase family protein [Clostridia bacterium]|nr:amidohydrolase family protein [Clostridia bacterium]